MSPHVRWGIKGSLALRGVSWWSGIHIMLAALHRKASGIHYYVMKVRREDSKKIGTLQRGLIIQRSVQPTNRARRCCPRPDQRNLLDCTAFNYSLHTKGSLSMFKLCHFQPESNTFIRRGRLAPVPTLQFKTTSDLMDDPFCAREPERQ